MTIGRRVHVEGWNRGVSLAIDGVVAGGAVRLKSKATQAVYVVPRAKLRLTRGDEPLLEEHER